MAGALTVLVPLAFALRPGPMQRVQGLPPMDNPFGVATGLHATLERIGPLLLLVVIVLSAASVLVRFRRDRAEQRAQLKWFLSAAAVFAVATALDRSGCARS